MISSNLWGSAKLVSCDIPKSSILIAEGPAVLTEPSILKLGITLAIVCRSGVWLPEESVLS